MTYFKKFITKNDSFDNTEKIWNSTISLPIYPSLSISKVNKICKILNSETNKLMKIYK